GELGKAESEQFSGHVAACEAGTANAARLRGRAAAQTTRNKKEDVVRIADDPPASPASVTMGDWLQLSQAGAGRFDETLAQGPEPERAQEATSFSFLSPAQRP